MFVALSSSTASFLSFSSHYSFKLIQILKRSFSIHSECPFFLSPARNLNEFPMCPSVVYPFRPSPLTLSHSSHEISTILVKQTANKQTNAKKREVGHSNLAIVVGYLLSPICFISVTFYSLVRYSFSDE